jgi:hypothetical protein
MVLSLEQAKKVGKLYMNEAKQMRIESLDAPGKSEIWNFDYESKDWVEQK